MSEPTFLGITKSQWDFYNSFSNWLSAIGTLAAVWVSLYLARRATAPKARVTVGHRIILQAGAQGQPPEYVLFNIVNTGERPLRITQIGWKVGLFRKRYAVQMYEHLLSSKLPIELSHGQEASWYVPLAFADDSWLRNFSKDLLMPHYRISCFTVRAQFFSSLGKTFVAKPEQNLLVKLKEACRGQSNGA
jgi:hypothetical protein